MAALDRLRVVDSFLPTVRYADPHRVRNDIGYLFQQYASLRPKVGIAPKAGNQVIYVYGTLPVPYKGSVYNIPVSIWVPTPYPGAPPLCVVEPTEGMIIKPRHQHVDSKGFCYLPYLAAWNPSVCSLVILASELSKVFSTDPPVRAKPPGYVDSVTDRPRGAEKKVKGVVPRHMSDRPSRSSSAPGGLSAEVRKAPRSRSPSAREPRSSAKGGSDKLIKKIHLDVKAMIEGTSMLEKKVSLQEEHAKMSYQLNEVSAFLSRHPPGYTLTLNVDTHDVVKGPPKQLLELVAQDATLDDLMYQLGKGLQNNSIPVSDYIVQMRGLSRQQFITRATIKKIEALQKKK